MNSRVSSSIEGIDPAVRERAEAAARRAGVSLNDWLNLNLGDTTPANTRSPWDQRPAIPARESPDVVDIHQRLDAITRQIEQITQVRPRSDAPRSEPTPVAQQLNDAIARLDARLSQISSPDSARQRQEQEKQHQAELVVERAAAQVYRPSPALDPASLDSTIAEISARQNELDGFSPQLMLRHAPPIVPAAPPAPPPAPTPAAVSAPPAPSPAPDFSSLEQHLLKITSQLESLRQPDHIEQSIVAFRSELAEIRQAITEAMPRQAIESIENEVRSLSRRIDDTRQTASDSQTLAGIERALDEIREVLRSLTPAEQLAGYDQAIRNLTAKLDQIIRANDDPSTIHKLENAIAALRAIVSNVASNDALVRLNDDVLALSAKVDQLARSDGRSDSLAVLEQRIAALTASLESREQRPAAHENSEQIEQALRALSDRIDRLPVGNDSASALAHLEQRVSYLLERLESSSDHRSGNLGRVEEGLQDILSHLERQHASIANFVATGRSEPAAQDNGLADLVKRELSDIRFSQAETDRQTQGSLEAVHNTLGHVVDRLSTIEGDLRAARTQPAVTPVTTSPAAAPEAPSYAAATLLPSAPEASYSAPEVYSAPEAAPAPSYSEEPSAARIAMATHAKPELPTPDAAQEPFAAAPREFHAASPAEPPAISSRTVGEILEPPAALPRTAIAPELPPDHPLEPGTRPSGRAASPSERIAASENAISGIPAAPKEPVSTSSFIAAARRAAQAAAAAPPPDKVGRPSKAGQPAGLAKAGSVLTSKIRSLLVGASVVVIVLGSFKMAMTLLDAGAPPAMPAAESSGDASSPAAPAGNDASPAMPTQISPSMTSPTPIGRQSFNNAGSTASDDGAASVAIPQSAVAPSISTTGDVTGTLPLSPASSGTGKLAMIQVPPTERLPETIGGPVLRAAVLKGDPSAAYEVGVRFAEGKGVAANYDEAAKWFDRAAHAGVVPAIFRLGTFYEKGLAVNKDVDIARRYYIQAAERGNAKAMHNLAVLDADGGGKGANYKSAAQWFRKAAEHGIVDSQYNLGILYARGIGVDQNLAESFKWFSLAAAQGDADAGHKRDDIAKRLDAQSLAAARLAIQTFTPEPQPDDAVNVASPAGGWDSAPAGNAKPAVKPVASKRTVSALTPPAPGH